MAVCEICGSELTGKQQRFCCLRCRNVSAGRISGALQKLPAPPKERLVEMYLMPPEGNGMTLGAIAAECGVSKVTVRGWIREYKIEQSANERIRFHGRKPKPWKRRTIPPRDELAALYLMPPEGKGMTVDAVAHWYQVARPTAWRWLNEMGLCQDFSSRHSQRMSGEGNPAYRNGDSQPYVKKELGRRQPPVCVWCGTEDDIQVHHLDHNRSNNKPENLTWLCYHCNMIEAHLWALSHKERAQVEWEGNMLIVRFTGKE